jgi:transposase-like protein
VSSTAPSGRRKSFTDAQLRNDLAANLKASAIAEKYGVSDRAVYKRISQLQQTTASAVVAPAESQRHVRQQLDVMEQLALNLKRANKLMDACDEWLQDPTNQDKYDIGPRSEEVEVSYRVEVEAGDKLIVQKRKKKLSELMGLLEGEADAEGGRIIAVDRGEYKHADPRELILKTQQETRQTAALVIDAMQKVADARALEQWRSAVIEEIGEESPEVARRIVQRLRGSFVLAAAFGGPGPTVGGSS